VNDKFLKDAILSTIAEIEGDIDNNISDNKNYDSTRENNSIINRETSFNNSNLINNDIEIKSVIVDTTNLSFQQKNSTYNNKNSIDEVEFLSNILQKLNVLFEGLKSDKLKKREEKTEMVIKYLQVLQISIEERVQKIK
jgi:hypothetical protein